jgi:hypothetical protein
MIPRLGLDLEPGFQIGRVLPDLDLLDIAYGATHGGIQSILAPLSAFGTGTPYSTELFMRPGLPVLIVKAELDQMDQVLNLGAAPDRLLLVGDRGRSLLDLSRLGEIVQLTSGFSQEIAALIEPDAASLKELARARAHWAVFSTESLVRTGSLAEAQSEIAKLTSASVVADKLNLRVALFGPTGRHLPSTFASIPALEEVFPSPDLWNLALRLGWERAVAEYRTLM